MKMLPRDVRQPFFGEGDILLKKKFERRNIMSGQKYEHTQRLKTVMLFQPLNETSKSINFNKKNIATHIIFIRYIFNAFTKPHGNSFLKVLSNNFR